MPTVKGKATRRLHCSRIFKKGFFNILNDMIENNVIFEFPTAYRAIMAVEKVPDEYYKKISEGKSLEGFDLSKLGYKWYQTYLTLYHKNGFSKKPILLDKELKGKLYKNACDGKYY